MPLSTSTASSAELALRAARDAGFEALVASSPATVRWLLRGRGRPVDAAAPEAAYTLVLTDDGAAALFPDIEAPRVEGEERLDEVGFEPVPYPWHEGPAEAIRSAAGARKVACDAELEPALAPLRRTLSPEELDRYRAAGADCADAVRAALGALRPEAAERDAAAALAAEARRRGFFPPVVLVAGERRQPVHRHPLPTASPLGRHALLAVTAEREGLHVSMTRLVSFGPPPAELARLAAAAARVDAAMLQASRPGTTLGDVLAIAAAAYDAEGFSQEWRRHHQGGLTGYRGREAFAVPGSEVEIPVRAAVAWNPSITGGAKSEDTALVTADGVEVVTRTSDLPEIETAGLARPGIVVL